MGIIGNHQITSFYRFSERRQFLGASPSFRFDIGRIFASRGLRPVAQGTNKQMRPSDDAASYHGGVYRFGYGTQVC